MPDVQIRIGNRYERLPEEQRAATDEFARALRDSGLSVEIEIIGYQPGRRVLTPVEWTSIFIGTNVATTLIGKLTTDLYERAKELLKRRLDKEDERPARALGFVIYGPNGEELRRWTTAQTEEEAKRL